jgi:hypothetical protein
VIYDEVPLWGSDCEDTYLKKPNTGDTSVFTKCFAAGFKLSSDPPAPHIEDLTVATVDTGFETDYSERLTSIIGSIRTQVKLQVNNAFLAGVKYRDDVEHYCAVEDDGSTIPPVPFPDLLVEHTPTEEEQKEIVVTDFRNLKRGEHDYTKRLRHRRPRPRNHSKDKRRNGRFPKS